tara:strand:- start:3355 stop:4614 length:1260 start_codon:yes stop_codon:yes gene_type:complete
MKKIKLFAVLLIAVFTVSLIPATVNAESLKEKDQRFIQEYKDAKNKYLIAENAYQDARAKYKTARGKVKQFKGLDDKSEAFEKADKFLTNSLSVLDDYNEVLIVWAENIEMSPDLRQNILDELSWHTGKIQDLQAEVDSATTTDELITTALKIKEHWLDQRVSAKRITGRLLSSRSEHVLRRANNLADQLQEKIDEKVAIDALDTNNQYQTALNDYKADIVLAEEDYDKAVDRWQSINSIPDLAPLDKEAKQFSRDANQHLKDAHTTLVEMVRLWKDEFGTAPETEIEEDISPYDVVKGGTGQLIASGDGVALVDGNGKVTITGGEGTLKITDFSGDASIDVSGEGNMTSEGDTDTYTGFDGAATIEGTSIKVELDGINLQLVADGTGSVMMAGDGEFTIGDFSGAWEPAGIEIELGEA